jgi:hypothetical protein
VASACSGSRTKVRHDIISGLIHLVPSGEGKVYIDLQSAWERICPYITGAQLLDLARVMVQLNAPLGRRSLQPEGWCLLLKACANSFEDVMSPPDEYSGTPELDMEEILAEAWVDHEEKVTTWLNDLRNESESEVAGWTEFEAVFLELWEADEAAEAAGSGAAPNQPEPPTALPPGSWRIPDFQIEYATMLPPCVVCQTSPPTHMPFTCQHLVLCEGEYSSHPRSFQFAHTRWSNAVKGVLSAWPRRFIRE